MPIGKDTKKIQAYVTKDTYDAVISLAATENRTESNMADILLVEALGVREVNKMLTNPGKRK